MPERRRYGARWLIDQLGDQAAVAKHVVARPTNASAAAQRCRCHLPRPDHLPTACYS